MKTAFVLVVFLALAGCQSTTTVLREKPACKPLPELAAKATRAQREAHYASVIRLYEQCAGGDQ